MKGGRSVLLPELRSATQMSCSWSGSAARQGGRTRKREKRVREDVAIAGDLSCRLWRVNRWV